MSEEQTSWRAGFVQICRKIWGISSFKDSASINVLTGLPQPASSHLGIDTILPQPASSHPGIDTILPHLAVLPVETFSLSSAEVVTSSSSVFSN